MPPPRAARPVGVVLVDKAPGPSSFAAVAALRARTGARTGHAGTLDPFASGLLVLMSGAATRLAPCFVGLDKRYLTELDLSATTTTGDPEGEIATRQAPPGRAELERAIEALRGEVELPIPAASAVKIRGERAYRLARRGVAVEMPLRRSRIHALTLLDYADGRATLAAHVQSGTYIRALATALGGHCVSLRRTAVGPFSFDEADPTLLLTPSSALERLPAAARAQVAAAIRERVIALEEAVSLSGGGSPQ
jgi:tRNA pseudouridine55 synthase